MKLVDNSDKVTFMMQWRYNLLNVSMAWHNTAETPLLMHSSNHSLVLSYRYNLTVFVARIILQEFYLGNAAAKQCCIIVN